MLNRIMMIQENHSRKTNAVRPEFISDSTANKLWWTKEKLAYKFKNPQIVHRFAFNSFRLTKLVCPNRISTPN